MDTSFFRRMPKPDFSELKRVLRGEKRAERVHNVELVVDRNVQDYILERFFDEKPVPISPETRRDFYRQQIRFNERMGYDYIRITGGPVLPWQGKYRQAQDTAALSRGTRCWTEEGTGMISSWEEFESYPWPDPDRLDYSPFELVSRNLPDGMKMMLCPSCGVFEVVSESLFGFENLSYLIQDNPDLVRAVTNRVGEILLATCRNMVEMDNSEGFFQGDDLGFKTGTFLSPDLLRELILPWHARCADLAHSKGKMYWLHSCGNLERIMEDLLGTVRIDAFHSFQDEIIPVSEFKRRYGERTSVLGGVDLNALCTLEEADLRRYVRNILKQCMPSRYALGSGNSVANYVPPENYLAMIEEGVNWAG